jgi:hypothetical protein
MNVPRAPKIKLYWESEKLHRGLADQRVADQRIDHAIEPVPKRFPHSWLAFVTR